MVNPLFAKTARTHEVDFRALTAQHFDEALTELLPRVQQEHEDLVTSAPTDYKAIFDNSPASSQVRACISLLSHLCSVQDTPELRDVYSKHIPTYAAISTQLGLDRRFYDLVVAFKNSTAYGELPAIYQKVVDKVEKHLVDAGVNLEGEKKQRLTELTARSHELSNKFSCNLADFDAEAKLVFSAEELAGLPARSLENAEKLPDGRYEVHRSAGLFDDIAMYCTVEATRRAVYEYDRNEGVSPGKDNREIIKEILALRQELAKLHGGQSYAALALEENMADTPDKAYNFVVELAKKALPQAKREVTEMESFGAELLGRPVEFWDRAFVARAHKEMLFKLDPEELRKYFPVSDVINGLFALIGQLYGIRFDQVTDRSVWHDDVLVYQLVDEAKEAALGYLYLDLYQRKFKDGGAWMNPVVSRHVQDGETRLPVVYIVCNAQKDAQRESTFTYRNVVTLFHEMGHALHSLLTEVDEEYFSGLSQVQHDAIELPSQFLENFAKNDAVLRGMSRHIETGECITDELLTKLRVSREYLGATSLLGSARYSILDMSLHMTDVVDPLQVENDVFSQWSVRKVDTSSFLLPAFSHLFAGGYAAGYYAYLWSEMLAADAFAALAEAGDTVEAQREGAISFRKNILAVGGLESMADNFRRFRGRDPQVDFLLAEYGVVTN